MDEKFLELRTKLDVARTQMTKENNKLTSMAKELRKKYALANRMNQLDAIETELYEKLIRQKTENVAKLEQMEYRSSFRSESFRPIIKSGSNEKLQTMRSNSNDSAQYTMNFASALSPSGHNDSNYFSNSPKNVTIKRPSSASATRRSTSAAANNLAYDEPLVGKMRPKSAANGRKASSFTTKGGYGGKETSGVIDTRNSLGEISLDKVINKIKVKHKKELNIPWDSERIRSELL